MDSNSQKPFTQENFIKHTQPPEIQHSAANTGAVTTNLSKTLFIRGMQCLKAIWLQKHRPELLSPPNEMQKMLFEQGIEVGRLANTLFPGGVEISTSQPYENRVAKTSDLIKSKPPAIFEATFAQDQLYLQSDVLKYNPDDDSWDLYVVKSSSSKKDIHTLDAALQNYVLKKFGISIRQSFLIYINSQYIREKELDPFQLFRDFTS